MKKVKSIDIVMENCEVYSVTIPNINILCKGISRCISTWNDDGTVLEELVADKVMLIITEYDVALSERLKLFADITHIDIIYDDDSNDYISVPWKGEGDINEAQKIEVTDNRIIITLED